jgi:hypothetical protein
MTADELLYIHSGRNGQLRTRERHPLEGATTPAQVDAIVESLRGVESLVIHFHGGLVSASSGIGTARRLDSEYSEFARPLFFVWESGPRETPVNNVDELVEGLAGIAGEEVFQKLTSVVTKWAKGKLTTGAGRKALDGQLDLPDDISHAIEMQRRVLGEAPYAELNPLPPVEFGEVDEAEREAMEAELRADTEFVAQVEAVLVGYAEQVGAEAPLKGHALKAALPDVAPAHTQMDRVVLDELAGEVEPGAKGLISAALLARHAGRVLVRVVRRFGAHRDHGLYTTVIEELLRELYLSSVGGVVWQIMKQDTSETWVATPGEVRGGERFLRGLAALGDERPGKIVLVGHSTGAVFINEMIQATRLLRESGDLPADFAYHGVVFLAPACTFPGFAAALPRPGELPLFHNFRLFTMDDASERANKLVPILYLRSLLYFVCGVVEREDDGSSAADLPLVGLQRCYGLGEHDPYAELPGIQQVREFVEGKVVWSPADGGPGWRADAVSHGGFDDSGPGSDGETRRMVIDSVRHVLQHGWATG